MLTKEKNNIGSYMSVNNPKACIFKGKDNSLQGVWKIH